MIRNLILGFGIIFSAGCTTPETPKATPCDCEKAKCECGCEKAKCEPCECEKCKN